MSRVSKGIMWGILALAAAVIVVGGYEYTQIADAGRSRESWEREWLCCTLVKLADTKIAIRDFRKRTGQLPADLTALQSKPIQDCWANPLSYRPSADGTYTLRSPGPDHILGTSDDEVSGEIDPESPKVPKRCADP